MRPHASGAKRGRALCALAALLFPSRAVAAGPPVFVDVSASVDAVTAKRVRDVVTSRRAVREEAPMPAPQSSSPERAAMDERVASIRLAQERALRLESEAAWSDCVREAAGALGDAVEVLSKVGDLGLLRDLHVQIGACLTLSDSAASARPHFIAAALLDEAPPKLGLHREEAEKAQAAARSEVIERLRGKLTIQSDPPGAEVWVDGRKIDGSTPVAVDVRLGDHYVTLRRFRFEPHTERTVLQPLGALRVALDPARRDTLGEQLAAVVARSVPDPPSIEKLLARAAWSRAEQVIAVAPSAAGAAQMSVIDVVTGAVLRSARVGATESDDDLRSRVCDALGETCAVKRGGIPWYVWPLGAAVLAGAAATTYLLIDANREYRFCPASGCR